MTLFEWLFQDPAALRRQTTAPLYNERLAFLTHMKERERKYNTLRAMATHLLQINRTLGFSNEMRVLTMEELRGAGRAWAQYTGPLRKRVPGKWSYDVYMRIARGWLCFHKCLDEPRKTRIFEHKLRDLEKTFAVDLVWLLRPSRCGRGMFRAFSSRSQSATLQCVT